MHPLFFVKERENNSSSTSMLSLLRYFLETVTDTVCVFLQQCFLSFLLAFGYLTSLCNVYCYYELNSPGAVLVKIATRATTALLRLLFSSWYPLETERKCAEQEMGWSRILSITVENSRERKEKTSRQPRYPMNLTEALCGCPPHPRLLWVHAAIISKQWVLSLWNQWLTDLKNGNKLKSLKIEMKCSVGRV